MKPVLAAIAIVACLTALWLIVGSKLQAQDLECYTDDFGYTYCYQTNPYPEYNTTYECYTDDWGYTYCNSY